MGTEVPQENWEGSFNTGVEGLIVVCVCVCIVHECATVSMLVHISLHHHGTTRCPAQSNVLK